MNNTYFGKLIYNDNAEFELRDETGFINITKMLDDIFDSGLKPQVYVKVMKGTSLLFEEDGLLTICRDEDGVDSFYICGLNLDKLMFYNTEEALEITIIKREKLRNNYGS